MIGRYLSIGAAASQGFKTVVLKNEFKGFFNHGLNGLVTRLFEPAVVTETQELDVEEVMVFHGAFREWYGINGCLNAK